MMKKMMKNIAGFFLTLLLLCATGVVRAADSDFPPSPNPPRLVNDLAGMLQPGQIQMLEQKLLAYTDSTSNEIAIVTISSIGQYDIADYSVRLFNKWGIGGKKHDNGLLVLVAKEQRKIWITTGYGLEGVLPDGLIGQIIRSEIEPSFKDRNFYKGLDQGTNALMEAARGEYKAESKSPQGKGGGIGTVIFILFVLFLFFIISGRGGGGSNRRNRRGGDGLLTDLGWIAASMLSNRGRSSGGWGGSGGFGGGSSGGGFGGFGGGSSGGGGAGGSW